MSRIFLLSPADCAGKRAQLVLNDGAAFGLARRLRGQDGVPVAELFSFLSGLYFRGKLAYASAFCSPPDGIPGILVITPNMGLVSADHSVNHAVLRKFSQTRIRLSDQGYRGPLERDAMDISKRIGNESDIVLLGSLATDKYLSILSPIFGNQLRFPAEFVGRGDMSRGALLLRCVREERELEYVNATREHLERKKLKSDHILG